MKTFDYEKGFCCIVVPAYEALPSHVKEAHKDLLPLVANLTQGKDLHIPLTAEIRKILSLLSLEELANLSRVSYFSGHWHPSLLPAPFDTKRGEGWKVANCIDQVLRERLAPLPLNILIHEGKLRVTFSSRNCWTWEEFGLATRQNLETFEGCGLPFGEDTLHDSADKLKTICADLWPSPEAVQENDLYRDLLEKKHEKQKADIEERFQDEIKRLQQDRKDAEIEIDFLRLLHSRHLPVENVIYYRHTKTFCFGWRKPITEAEKTEILQGLEGEQDLPKIEFKTI